jgi:hypothetical protein
MTELAVVLAEYSLDNNAYGWFRLPWRNGWNAIELAMQATLKLESGLCESSQRDWLLSVCQYRAIDQETYWIAQDQLSTTPSPMMRAALRCLQVLIAKSDGGGEVYNAILVNRFEALLPEQVADLILEHRCRDSIGVSAELNGDRNDRLRRAFTIAWKRGLYMAAYSLPPVTLFPDNHKLTVIK